MPKFKKSVLVSVIIAFLSTSLSGGYWSHRTKSLQGKHVYITKEGIKFRYLLIDNKHDGILKLTMGRSCKFVFYRITKDTVTITLEKDGVVKKTWKLTKRVQTFRAYLPKGEYKIKSSKRVRLRFYVWRNVRLKNLQPIGGGYPVTLSIGEKKYPYYRVSGDTVLSVRVKGKAKIWAYFRPDIKPKEKAKVYEIRILEDGKTIKRSRVRLRPSKKAKYLERNEITPGLPIRVPIYVKKGVHEYILKVVKGSGYAKFYLEEAIKRSKPKNKKTSIKKKLGIGLIGKPPNAIFPMFRGFFPTNKVPYFPVVKITSELYYDSNPFKFSDKDLNSIRTDTKGYLFPSVSNPQDLVMKVSMTPSIRYNKTEIGLKVSFYGHLRNITKNSSIYGFELTQRVSNRIRVGANFYSRGNTFLRPVYTYFKGYPAVYPLSYRYRRFNIWGKRTKVTSKLSWVKVGVSYVQYKYHYPFDYLSGVRTGVEISGKVKIKGFSVYPRIQIGQYISGEREPWESDYSHTVHTIGLQVSYKNIPLKPGLDLGIERKTFITQNVWDKLHYQRVDLLTRFGVRFALPYPTSGLRLRFSYEQRRLSLPPGVAGIFKDYKRWIVGLIYSGTIKWD